MKKNILLLMIIFLLVGCSNSTDERAEVSSDNGVFYEIFVRSFAGNFNNFGLIYFLTQGGPVNPNFIYAGHTDILISWIYKLTLDYRMYNMASVMSIIIFLIIGTFSAWNFTRTAAFKED